MAPNFLILAKYSLSSVGRGQRRGQSCAERFGLSSEELPPPLRVQLTYQAKRPSQRPRHRSTSHMKGPGEGRVLP
ncbi:MAG: hypothetical protein OXC62_01135 [Aestuariivita sp.]|nr:hypothetical protein [Aestuariivita sp.]